MLPQVSLVIPCYNAAETIERTILSLINQNYASLQLILIDGASTDETMTIVEKYRSYFYMVISESDQGQANALNKGFTHATGEWRGWLCADDELLPNSIQHLVAILLENPEINLITGGCQRIFADGTIVETTPRVDVMERISYHNGIEQPSTIWKSELHYKAGEINETYNYAFDWYWWNQLKCAGANIKVDDRIISRYYFSDTNKTSTGSRKLVEEMYRVIKKFGPLRGFLADIYLFLYLNFDLYGCYDKPVRVSNLRSFIWSVSLVILILCCSKDLIFAYNWNFASKQERGICWYR